MADKTQPRNLSFRWWESRPIHLCPCGRIHATVNFEPSRTSLREYGYWETRCPCTRVLVLYDLAFKSRPLPRGPAPTQEELDTGLTEEDVYDRYW